MKSYTDIEQSKVLSKILPLESADMTLPFRHTQKDIIVLGTVYSINIQTKNTKWFISYKCNNEEFVEVYSNIFVDACYEMTIKLNEQNLL